MVDPLHVLMAFSKKEVSMHAVMRALVEHDECTEGAGSARYAADLS